MSVPHKSPLYASLSPMQKLLSIMEYLRTHQDGCAWTQAQTHQTLSPYLIEEAYETAEVIDQGKTDQILCDELGDILLQIVFHASIANQRGAFSFDDVAQAIVDKLTRRYPTILGDEPNTLKTPEEIDRRWEEVKAEERKKKGLTPDSSIMDEVSHAMPALLRASKLKARASKAGFEWPDMSMLLDKVIEEANEMKAELAAEKITPERVAAEFGDLMFLMVDFARLHGVDAEDALRTTNNRFESRFRYVEKGLSAQKMNFKTADFAVKRALWEEAKEKEKSA